MNPNDSPFNLLPRNKKKALAALLPGGFALLLKTLMVSLIFFYGLYRLEQKLLTQEKHFFLQWAHLLGENKEGFPKARKPDAAYYGPFLFRLLSTPPFSLSSQAILTIKSEGTFQISGEFSMKDFLDLHHSLEESSLNWKIHQPSPENEGKFYCEGYLF